MKVFCTALFLFNFFLSTQVLGQRVSESFEFEFENKTLSGLIEKAEGQNPQALVIIIPGYGRTDFVEGQWFSQLRDHFVNAGLTVVLWDKMGCGKSKGVFDAQQPVKNSAQEALTAIEEIKRLKVAGYEKIGLWGISRAGWICPLINQQFPIDFWISVSGTDDKENYGYLLRENLIIAGKTGAEADLLHQAWLAAHKAQCTAASFEEYLAAVKPLTEDSLCQKLFNYTAIKEITPAARLAYQQEIQNYTRKGYFDEESGLWVYIEDFDQVLHQIKCPVLALFGEKDSQVDWRKTKRLYEQSIGTASQNAQLTTKVFEQCNHSLQKCESCAFGEDLSAFNWQACNNYYETITDWLRDNSIID
ncbi:MAG: alpha/beta hydrolase [Bacteroidota bacterium]